MPRPAIFVALTFVLAGMVSCTPTTLATLSSPIDGAALSAYTATGSATLSGEGFARRATGRLKRCSGARVTLVPALPVLDEAVLAWRAGRTVDASRIPVAGTARAVRTTECNSRGRFSFKGVPPLDYWVFVPIKWYDIDRPSKLRFPRGGMFAARYSLGGGSQRGVVIDNEDFIGDVDPYLVISRLTSDR
ncbi:MAG: hypothetical protein AAF615_09295 [Pseudomonadota bacterium]